MQTCNTCVYMIQPSIVVVFTPLKPNKKKHGDFSLRIQVAARNALRVQFGGYSIFLGGTWIHKVCCLLPKKMVFRWRHSKKNMKRCVYTEWCNPGTTRDLQGNWGVVWAGGTMPSNFPGRGYVEIFGWEKRSS